jgi:SAM-dependent methyltransferase
VKYYQLHEEFWQRLVEKGHISWDKESKSELMSRDRNKTLDKYIDRQNIGKALDLGCGSGSQSFYLSKLGYDCTAVDISQTAIEKGKELSRDLGLEINFLCDDICKLNLNDKFDLVTDSCLLHCLVWERERTAFFDVAKKHLSKDGRFFIYTMIREKNQNLWQDNDSFLLDDEGVLWSKGPDSFDVDWTIIDGKKYFPHRRVFTVEEQRAELVKNGFEILEEEIIKNSNETPLTYVAWLK